ncbi:nucleotidyltransferase family protein [Devosia sp. FKR38]|uniref:nucleotidyltransferase family protein n=1 Tax=Devosia sp. FKR38 TaxID=2562312 RepID=UPI0010BFBF88|nr:nucleotidyltransferase family protein [Devosia sp. FKR38]
MGDHLKYAGADAATQRQALDAIIRSEPVLMAVLSGLQRLALPDALLVSGAIYNVVWNRLTGRPALRGVNDIDVFYFDAGDLSWEAEDRAIKALDAALGPMPLPVQLRNQARVHLWYEQKFGIAFSPLRSSAEMLERFASKTHAVGARLDDAQRLELVAPFGLDDLFAFRVTPNVATDNRVTHTNKGERIRALWPEVTVVPWPDLP